MLIYIISEARAYPQRYSSPKNIENCAIPHNTLLHSSINTDEEKEIIVWIIEEECKFPYY